MRRRIALLIAPAGGLAGCASEPLYFTSPEYRDIDGYSFIMPYVTKVQTIVTATLAKGPSTTKTDTSGPPTATTSQTLTVTLTPRPASRGYLYLKKNPLFSDQANVTTDTNGLLASSDSSSSQQVTAILNEIAAAAQSFVGAHLAETTEPKAIPNDPGAICNAYVNKLTANAPFIKQLGKYETNPVDGEQMIIARGTFPYVVDTGTKDEVGKPVTLDKTADVHLFAKFSTLLNAGAQIDRDEVAYGVDGIVAFFPVPMTITIQCTETEVGKMKKNSEPVLMNSPVTVNFYSESHVIRPNRDFFTNPQDTYTFSAGFITGHKFTEQSPAKTVVDTVAQPVKAFLPSVSVQQSTQVQTGGGKPDQTTTTTQTTAGPPK